MAINHRDQARLEWRAQRDSNPQPTDLESAALPIRAIRPIFKKKGPDIRPLSIEK